jgi:hypothetical protein
VDQPRIARWTLSCLAAVSARGSIGSTAMGQSTPVAAYKISPAPAVVSGQPTTALGTAVGQTYTFILCEESGREMLCGLSPAPAGSHGGDTSLTAVGFATQERSQLLGSCLQFTEQVGDTPVLCTVGVTASMYTVELGDGSVQQVAGEELIRAYTSPTGTFIIRSLHALAVVDITPPRATHFVVGVADENGEVTELVSWALDEASQPTLQQLNESDEAVLLASGGTLQLASDSATVDACIAQCRLEQLEEGARLWGVLQDHLATCDSDPLSDPATQQYMRDCMEDMAVGGGIGGAAIGYCVVGVPAGAAAALPCSVAGPVGTAGGFCVGFGVGGSAGAGWGLAAGAACGGLLGRCWGWFWSEDVCRDAAWDSYAQGILDSAAAYDACRTVRCGG